MRLARSHNARQALALVRLVARRVQCLRDGQRVHGDPIGDQARTAPRRLALALAQDARRLGAPALRNRSLVALAATVRIPMPPTFDPVDAAEVPHIRAELGSTATQHGSSRWAEYEHCPRGYQLRYHLGIYPRQRITVFAVGSLVHAVLAYSARAVLRGVEVDWRNVLAFAAASGDPQYLGDGFDEDPITEAHRLCWAYFDFWGTQNAGLPVEVEIVAVERLVEVVGAAPYSTRLDVMVRLPDGRLAFIDHKTKAQSYSSDRDLLVRKLATRPQFLGSSWAMRKALDLDYAPLCIVNGIIKTKVPKFDRIPVRFEVEQLDNWNANRERMATTGYVDTHCNYTQCAPDFGSPCWAFEYCHGDAASKAANFTEGVIT